MSKTIAAIATPLGTGGISVIRISGDNSIEIADRLFTAKNGRQLNNNKGYTASFGEIYDKDKNLIDTVVATVFRNPKSYTGEDVVEFSCHGGIYVTREILRLIYENGVKPAEPGEFTKRAFLNGKINLTQAEAVIDIINAKSETALTAARTQYNNALFSEIQQITDELLKIAGHLGAWVDYPDDDIIEVDEKKLKDDLSSAKDTIKKLIEEFNRGQLIKNGIDTVIAGKPNVGKSTLMNLLVGYNRSIVTDIEGTTRDVVEEEITLGEIILRLSDTAGIRETEDKVEKIGVSLAKERLSSASLTLVVVDGSKEPDETDFKLASDIKNKAAVAVINKTDLGISKGIYDLEKEYKNYVEISALDKGSIEELERIIKRVVRLNDFDLNAPMLATERQRSCAINAKRSLEEAIFALESGITLDAVTVMVEDSIDNLLELTGKRTSEEVVNNLFSQFCVGK